MGRSRRRVLPARTRRTLWLVGTAVAAALVIAIGSAYSVLRPSQHATVSSGVAASDSDGSYRAALAALASGETTKAHELLRVAADAGNVDARSKLDELARTPSGSTTPTPAPPTANAYEGPAADVAAFLPTSVTGYTVSDAERSGSGAILSLQPTYQGPYGTVSLVVMTVLDKGSEASARAYVDQLPRAYPASGENVMVGAYPGRFGTDGSRLAAVAFSRGRFAFEVVATASRPDPTKIKSIALGVAAAFPAAR
jgi:hypothetical protein